MNTYDIKNGLRPPELLLIGQAISAYVQKYNAIKASRQDEIGKREAQERVDAAVALGERIRLETVLHDPK